MAIIQHHVRHRHAKLRGRSASAVVVAHDSCATASMAGMNAVRPRPTSTRITAALVHAVYRRHEQHHCSLTRRRFSCVTHGDFRRAQTRSGGCGSSDRRGCAAGNAVFLEEEPPPMPLRRRTITSLDPRIALRACALGIAPGNMQTGAYVVYDRENKSCWCWGRCRRCARRRSACGDVRRRACLRSCWPWAMPWGRNLSWAITTAPAPRPHEVKAVQAIVLGIAITTLCGNARPRPDLYAHFLFGLPVEIYMEGNVFWASQLILRSFSSCLFEPSARILRRRARRRSDRAALARQMFAIPLLRSFCQCCPSRRLACGALDQLRYNIHAHREAVFSLEWLWRLRAAEAGEMNGFRRAFPAAWPFPSCFVCVHNEITVG